MEVLAIVFGGIVLLNVMVVSLCVAARRGDEVAFSVPMVMPAQERPRDVVDDPGWVATIATPAAKPARTSASVRVRQHQ